MFAPANTTGRLLSDQCDAYKGSHLSHINIHLKNRFYVLGLKYVEQQTAGGNNNIVVRILKCSI